MKIEYYDVVIIGAGVSGTFSALYSNNQYRICLIDKNKDILKKFLITGKGKANIANTSKPNEFIKNLIGNNKFIYPALNNFNGLNIINFLDEHHIKYHEKEPFRFHLDIENVEFRKIIHDELKKKTHLTLKLNTNIIDVKYINHEFEIVTENHEIIKAKQLIVATGGLSYKNTGCNGFGYKIAKQFKHEVKPLFPIGVGLLINNEQLTTLQGISLNHIEVSVYNNQNKIYSEIGDLMFTHYGFGGPVIRRVSGYVSYGLMNHDDMSIKISYLSLETIENELNTHHYLHQCFKTINKKVLNVLLKNFDPKLDLKNINKTTKKAIIDSLYEVNYNINQTDVIDVAINTGGGVSLKEINPNNYASKNNENLFFIGETIDINPRTNGYNITCCISMAKKCIDYINNLYKNKSSH